MAIPRRKSLAGTKGIPLEENRTYADDVVLEGLDGPFAERDFVGRVVLNGGEAWNVRSVLSRREFGRGILGNLVVHYSLKVGGGSRDLWWEGGRWLSRKQGGAGRKKPSEPQPQNRA